MVIWGWKNLLDRPALERDPIAELVRIYKETNERSTSDLATNTRKFLSEIIEREGRERIWPK